MTESSPRLCIGLDCAAYAQARLIAVPLVEEQKLLGGALMPVLQVIWLVPPD